ncbi:MAG: two-component sensor histidine kinase [Desulfobacterales bacterium]|nr:two-component sensor histidine kinase [Desulfobacterales bacterium]
MKKTSTKPESELYVKLKWLMFFRLIFTTLLLGSTIALHVGESVSPMASPLLFLYALICGVFFLSFIYALILKRTKREKTFAQAQIGLDTLVVTLIIFVTGGFSSIFSFLYLVVIIYASELLFRKGSLLAALMCGAQYAMMIALDYYNILAPYVFNADDLAMNQPWSQVLYKIVITAGACFAVAFLSGFLAEQYLKTRHKLKAMEERVRRVEKMAAIGEMGAGLAHEIRNPLASLTGSIQLLREDLLKGEIAYDPVHDKLMQIILREADSLGALVNNFLLFARPPTGEAEFIDLKDALTGILELFEKGDNCRGRITVTRDLHPGVVIEMDPVHLRQVIWNLLLNASEAIEETGHIHVFIRNLKSGEAGIRITDDGCGMTPEVRKSIFDPFFTTKAKGTGLGLSIVHSILESYDSWLEVESAVNEGATVSLRIKGASPDKAREALSTGGGAGKEYGRYPRPGD